MICNKCKITIRGQKERCPLCQGELTPTNDSGITCFPAVKKPRATVGLFIRLMTLGAVSICVICGAINYLIPQSGHWDFFVYAGVGCAWLYGIFAIMNRYRLVKNIFMQLFIATFFALAWDTSVGWTGWSVDYVIPLCCLAGMISVFVLSLVLKDLDAEYMVYLIIWIAYSILPGVLLITDTVHVRIPSVVCVAVGIIQLSIIVIFRWKIFIEEMKRKFHI